MWYGISSFSSGMSHSQQGSAADLKTIEWQLLHKAISEATPALRECTLEVIFLVLSDPLVVQSPEGMGDLSTHSPADKRTFFTFEHWMGITKKQLRELCPTPHWSGYDSSWQLELEQLLPDTYEAAVDVTLFFFTQQQVPLSTLEVPVLKSASACSYPSKLRKRDWRRVVWGVAVSCGVCTDSVHYWDPSSDWTRDMDSE